MLGLTGWWGWRYQRMKDRVEALEKSPERQPVKAKFRKEFRIGFWTDPRDGERKQIWLPVLWLEYEDGSFKKLEIEDLIKDEKVNMFPFPISFQEDD